MGCRNFSVHRFKMKERSNLIMEEGRIQIPSGRSSRLGLRLALR